MNARRSNALALTVLAVLSFFVFAFAFLRFPLIHDSDSYLHLAIARFYGERGFVEVLPWTRLSALNEGLGDKELLFHAALVPFSSWMDAAVGGRLALAAFNTAIVVTVAVLAVRMIGSWGFVVPILLYLGSMPFLSRAVRLRPELLSLLLLLAAISFASRRAWILFGVVSFLYALSYTAIHFYLGLAGFWFLIDWWFERRPNWRTILVPCLGVSAGVLCHPGFPSNVRVWYFQAVLFFQMKSSLDVGNEIFPPLMGPALLASAGLIVGIGAILLARQRAEVDVEEGDQRLARYLGVSACVTAMMYASMARMSIYAAPIIALAVLAIFRSRGFSLTRTMRLGVVRIPLFVGIGVALLLGILSLRGTPLIAMTREGPTMVAEADWEAFGRVVPDQARIATDWANAELYAFWAPQGQYLNVLDPMFMAIPYPRQYALQRRVFAGEEPDIPLAVAGELLSDFIAFDRTGAPEPLLERVTHDPRILAIDSGYQFLGRLSPEGQKFFVLDWRAVIIRNRWPNFADVERFGSPWPRAKNRHERAIEGFVDANRLGTGTCFAFVRRLDSRGESAIAYEFVPYGPAELRVDGETIVSVDASVRGILGRGVRVSIPASADQRFLEVRTCGATNGRAGFYLLERQDASIRD